MLRLKGEENHNRVVLKEAYEKLDQLTTQASNDILQQRILKSKEALEKVL
jgi:hypothetical protein